MKKIFSLLFAVLVGTMLFGQVSMDLNVIGRVDTNPRFTFDGEKPTHNWANSGFYTDLEMSFGDYVSMSLVNHWAASDENPKFPFMATPELYKSTWTSDSDFGTWCDYFYFDFTPLERFSIRIGKDMMAMGGFEYDDWDWDVDYDLASTLWQNLTTYQWGASIAWNNEAETTSFRLQAVSSPFSYNSKDIARPWHNGLGSYFFLHEGEYADGVFETRNSLGYIANDTASGLLNAVLGFKANVCEGLSLNVDLFDAYYVGGKNPKENIFHTLGVVKYEDPAEKWEIMGKFGYENGWFRSSVFDLEDNEMSRHQFFGGVTAAYFPLREKKDLRIQATLACNPYLDYSAERNKSLSFTVGVTYNLPIHIL